MERFVGIAHKRKPKAIAILGDLTEEKDRHTARLVNRIVGHIKEMSQVAPVLVLMGNHDYRNEGHPFFEFLSMLPNVWWVGKVCTEQQLPKSFHEAFANCLFLPHTLNHDRDWKGVAMKGRRYIFAHNTFTGANVGFGRELGGIDLDVFPRAAKVIAGDIHVPQTLGPVTYIGAPYTVDFGDDYKARLLWLGRDYITSISVAKFPQKRLVEVGDVAELPKAEGLNKGDLLKVRLHLTDSGKYGEAHRATLEFCEQHGYHLAKFAPIIESPTARKRVHIKDSGQSDKEVMAQFAKRNSLDDRTLQMGLEFVEHIR
jgi:hypothetical protein